MKVYKPGFVLLLCFAVLVVPTTWDITGKAYLRNVNSGELLLMENVALQFEKQIIPQHFEIQVKPLECSYAKTRMPIMVFLNRKFKIVATRLFSNFSNFKIHNPNKTVHFFSKKQWTNFELTPIYVGGYNLYPNLPTEYHSNYFNIYCNNWTLIEHNSTKRLYRIESPSISIGDDEYENRILRLEHDTYPLLVDFKQIHYVYLIKKNNYVDIIIFVNYDKNLQPKW